MDLARFRYYTNWHQFANERRYDAPADPWRLLRVDPTAVDYYNQELALDWGLGRVAGGDWDREANCEPVRETTTFRGLAQRFEEGRDWEETALYRRAREAFEGGETFRGYDSLAEYREIRCEHVDDLFRSIERDGYRPNAAATHESPEDNGFEEAYVHHLEPLVVVGRAGDIYLTEGYHRFAIASLLGVDAVPVNVLARHEGWQRTRDRVHDTSAHPVRTGLDVPGDHPDLADVVP